MAAVTDAEEEYLQSIFWLQEAGLPMTAANLARAMQLSAPTVHEMIGRLEKDGYVVRDEHKKLAFTSEGREHGIPWDEVHEEAERLEHAMSPVLEARMLAAIGDAKTCPHGHPIDSADRIVGVPLADVEIDAKVRVLRFENEAEDLLHYLKETGMEPGLRGVLSAKDDDEVTVTFEGGTDATVTASVAETISVTADPSPPPRAALPEQIVLGKDRYGR
jgi:DtxR family Mn-dependent transcriptional regulator